MIEAALELLPERVRDALAPLVRVVVGEVEEVAAVAVDFVAQRDFRAATGPLLDQWGKLIGEPRRGMADILYRRMIASRILQNSSGGEAERILTILRTMVDTEEELLAPSLPAGYALHYRVRVPLSDTAAQWLGRRIVKSTAAGVGVDVVEVLDSALRLDSDYPESLDGYGLSRSIYSDG